MSCVIVLAPVVVAALPVLTASIVAAVSVAGFTVVKGAKGVKRASTKQEQSVELEIENADVVGEGLRADSEIVCEKDGVRVIFRRDARGRLQTCVEGPRSKEELRKIGEDLSGRVIQQYVHRRLAEELGQAGFTTVNEDVGPDESIRLHVRRFEQ